MIHLNAASGLRPLTLRNLPPALARAVKDRAARDGVSLNKAVIRMLEEGLRAPRAKPGKVGHALDDFIGVLSSAEADELIRLAAEERKANAERWR